MRGRLLLSYLSHNFSEGLQNAVLASDSRMKSFHWLAKKSSRGLAQRLPCRTDWSGVAKPNDARVRVSPRERYMKISLMTRVGVETGASVQR